MFRDEMPLRNIDHMHFILNHAALGDTISSLPAVKWARENHTQDIGMTVWLPDFYLPLMEVIMPYEGLSFQPLHEFNDKTNDKKVAGPGAMNAIPSNVVTRNKMDMVRFAYMAMLDREPEESEMNYPTGPVGPSPIEIEGRYVAISSGATSKNKVFHADVLGPVIKAMLVKGYKVVILGKSTTIVRAVNEEKPLEMIHEFDNLPQEIKEQCIDLRDKTSLVDARNIIAHAECFFGVDGGLLHLAGTTDVPIVYGITSVDPVHRPIRRWGIKNWRLKHITPRGLDCAGCQSHWTLMFKHDFRFCAYKDYKCVTALNPDDFIDAFDDLYFERREYP